LTRDSVYRLIKPRRLRPIARKFYLARFRSSFPLKLNNFTRPKFRNCPTQYNFHDVHADDIYNQAGITFAGSRYSLPCPEVAWNESVDPLLFALNHYAGSQVYRTLTVGLVRGRLTISPADRMTVPTPMCKYSVRLYDPSICSLNNTPFQTKSTHQSKSNGNL